MSVKEHYDKHLGNFYSWMVGDFDTLKNEFLNFCLQQNLMPFYNKRALDLGAGNGVQSHTLSELGYSVTAIDFNDQLLSELEENCNGKDVTVVKDDIRNVDCFSKEVPELIICWGDTLTHLDSIGQVEKFLKDCISILSPEGKLLLSFRDYSIELREDNRFIPVKSDNKRVLTCFLEYFNDYVRVTDIFYELADSHWKTSISSYQKVRLSESFVVKTLEANSIKIDHLSNVRGMIRLVATLI